MYLLRGAQYKKTLLTCVTLFIAVYTGGCVYAVTSLIRQAHHGTQAGFLFR